MTNPLTLDEIETAARTISDQAKQTPVATSPELDAELGAAVFCKVEAAQRAGSFKFRGAFNRLSHIPDSERGSGVVAVSSGNHGAAVSVAAKILGMPAVIFIPHDTPVAKRSLMEDAGAEVVTFDRMTEDRDALAKVRVDDTGATFVHPYEDRLIMAGQGTAAYELHHQVGPLDQLLVPVSGGGLMAGSASAMTALDPTCELIGVEPANADDTRQSMLAGLPVSIDPPNTIADGLAVTSPGDNTFAINRHLVSEIRTVTEEQIATAMALLHRTLGLVVEPSGAVGIAALQAARPQDSSANTKRRVGVILSGGNVDRELFERLTST